MKGSLTAIFTGHLLGLVLVLYLWFFGHQNIAICILAFGVFANSLTNRLRQLGEKLRP